MKRAGVRGCALTYESLTRGGGSRVLDRGGSFLRCQSDGGKGPSGRDRIATGFQPVAVPVGVFVGRSH